VHLQFRSDQSFSGSHLTDRNRSFLDQLSQMDKELKNREDCCRFTGNIFLVASAPSQGQPNERKDLLRRYTPGVDQDVNQRLPFQF
jgi:hypothetical protein